MGYNGYWQCFLSYTLDEMVYSTGIKNQGFYTFQYKNLDQICYENLNSIDLPI